MLQHIFKERYKKMASENKRYQLAQFVFNDTEVVADSFKLTRKQDTETYTSFNSHNPYCVAINGETYGWELSDVDPLQKPVFEKAMEAQKNNTSDLPLIATYNFDVSGDLVEDDVLYGVFITELSKEANKPFSVKGEALRLKPKE